MERHRGRDAQPRLQHAAGKLRLRNGRNFSRTGAFTNNGLIDLDDSTTFSTTANYIQGAGGTFATDIAGTVAGTSYGRLSVGATASLNGTLDADFSAYRRRPVTSLTCSPRPRAPAPLRA